METAKFGWKEIGLPMFRRWVERSLLFGIAAIAVAAGLALRAQSSGTVFRSDVKLVRILATVKDASGVVTGALNRDDFAIQDNGVPQEISLFETETSQPLSIAVLIDASASTAKDIKYETDSVTRFARAVMKGGNMYDAVSLYSFNWQVVQQVGFTRDPATIDRQLRQVRSEAGTSMYDAIVLASKDLQDRHGRKVLIVVSDGGDTLSRSSFAKAAESAQTADAVIFPVLVTPVLADAGRNVGGENALTTLAQRTGGRVFRPSVGAEMDKAFDGILRDLRTQYLIGFYSKNVPLKADRYHALTVTLTAPDKTGWTVAARDGYYGDALPVNSARGNQSPSVTGPSADESVRTKKTTAGTTKQTSR